MTAAREDFRGRIAGSDTAARDTAARDIAARDIAARNPHVGIIGLGYVGLPLALMFCEAGIRVTGLDIDQAKVDALNQGHSYIQRISADAITAARRTGFVGTTEFAALATCDAILICVPTPLKTGSGGEAAHEPDTSFIENTVAALAPHTRTGQLIVLESTTWPGTTTELVVPILDRLAPNGLKVQRDDTQADTGLLVAFSPEREDPGNTTVSPMEVPKLIGGMTRTASEAAASLYGLVFERTVQMSSPAAAEMTKLLENIYRSVNIALVNEMKQLCLAMDLDIWEVIEAAATKPFGYQAFYPGPGIGGHCIPVDPFYLSWRAQQFGHPTRFIQLAGEVNEAMPGHVVAAVEQALGGLAGRRFLLLGIAYKADIDDLRESPSLRIFELLRAAGAEVAYNDPFFPTVGSGRHYALEASSVPLATVGDYDAVLLLTTHSAYDIPALVAGSKLFFDTRNATRGLNAGNIVRC